MLLLIIVALVICGLFRIVDLSAGQNKEMRVPLLGEKERKKMKTAKMGQNLVKYLDDPRVTLKGGQSE